MSEKVRGKFLSKLIFVEKMLEVKFRPKIVGGKFLSKIS